MGIKNSLVSVEVVGHQAMTYREPALHCQALSNLGR